jgi:hypothetical protein
MIFSLKNIKKMKTKTLVYLVHSSLGLLSANTPLHPLWLLYCYLTGQEFTYGRWMWDLITFRSTQLVKSFSFPFINSATYI